MIRIYTKERREKYNLVSEALEDRQKQFAKRSLDLLKDFSGRMFRLSGSTYVRVPSIDLLLAGTELSDTRFVTGSSYIEIFTESEQSYQVFLVDLEILLQSYFNKKGNSELDPRTDDFIGSILSLLKLLDLDYVWNEKTNTLERKISEADVLVINENLQKISANENKSNEEYYESCFNDFLKTRKSTEDDKFFNKSLNDIKSVLERTVDNQFNLKLSQKEELLKKLLGKSEEESPQLKSLEFIIKNIHHSQKGEDGKATPKKFMENEYVYWWLEINKLIYLAYRTNP